MAKSRGLGRGLDSLIPPVRQKEPPQPAAGSDSGAGKAWELPVERIAPSRWQPRRDFDADRLAELAQSIAEHGLIHPLVVREHDGGYELISGERRLRAIRDVLKWDKAPVRLMNAEDAKMRELALVENLQRDDLNPIEEALAYQELRKDLGITHEAIADRLKVSRPKITNTMRLLELPEEVKRMVMDGSLPAGTARALLTVQNPLAQIKLARQAVAEGLSTRKVEQLASEKQREKPEKQPEKKRPSHIESLEDRLRRHFGSKVVVDDNKGKGRIIIEYHSVDEAQRLLDCMGLPPE